MTLAPIYPCLSVITPTSNTDKISMTLEDLGAVAIEERDDTTMVKSTQGEVELVAGFSDPKSREMALTALLELSGDDLVVHTFDVKDDDWRNNWKKYFNPVVLSKLQVITPWMKPPSKDRLIIVIDPGQAFGTGGHATTKCILKLLEKQANTPGGLPGRILDIGTGSGVLAIAAAKLGASSVTAIDIEEESVSSTSDNLRINNVAKAVIPLLGEARDLDEQWPLVLANLELSIFLEYHMDIANRVEPGGTIYTSGLLAEQVDEFTSLFSSFELIDRLDEEGWSGLEMRRK